MSTQQTESTAEGTTEAPLDQVLAIVRTALGKPGLTPDDEVMDYGGTSLSVVLILSKLKNELGLNVDLRALDGSVTARSLVRAAR
ncbi:acyl carrier protein [Streptomyces sp. NPDC046332]|uniref:acyl carrier protein n=1 Tax=Streptomyces sp. NPDC046332 TaxID=3155133 RepID=UPI0033E7F849